MRKRVAAYMWAVQFLTLLSSLRRDGVDDGVIGGGRSGTENFTEAGCYITPLDRSEACDDLIGGGRVGTKTSPKLTAIVRLWIPSETRRKRGLSLKSLKWAASAQKPSPKLTVTCFGDRLKLGDSVA